jgi:hypothetical protein
MVTGEDWDRKPYECNAGDPYVEEPWISFKVAFDGDWAQPKYGHWNSPWSVEQINKKMVPWLRTQTYADKQIAIFAGTPLLEFCKLIKEGGGNYYLDRQTWLWIMSESYVIPEVGK